MDTKNLIRFLRNDLVELTDILSEINPGTSLSEIELKLIKSRVRSLTEEFEMLDSSISNPSVKVKNRETIAEQTVKKSEQSQNDFVDVVEPEPLVKDSGSKVGPTPSVKLAKEENQQNVVVRDKETQPDLQYDVQPEIEVESGHEDMFKVQHETQPELDDDVEESVLQEDIPLESSRRQTIAEKYNGVSDSFNDRMAAHIVQQDLASKLKQHPIENLNKAIKLNDKVWFIKELFNGNADLYKETVNAINKMADMDEALTFIEQNFSFDQDKESFKSFIEFVYRRFLK